MLVSLKYLRGRGVLVALRPVYLGRPEVSALLRSCLTGGIFVIVLDTGVIAGGQCFDLQGKIVRELGTIRRREMHLCALGSIKQRN